MQTHQLTWSAAGGWRSSGAAQTDADLVLYFGLRSALADGARYRELRAHVRQGPRRRLQHRRTNPQ